MVIQTKSESPNAPYTIAKAEKRLNIQLSEIKVVAVHWMLAISNHILKEVELDAMKEKDSGPS